MKTKLKNIIFIVLISIILSTNIILADEQISIEQISGEYPCIKYATEEFNFMNRAQSISDNYKYFEVTINSGGTYGINAPNGISNNYSETIENNRLSYEFLIRNITIVEYDEEDEEYVSYYADLGTYRDSILIPEAADTDGAILSQNYAYEGIVYDAIFNLEEGKSYILAIKADEVSEEDINNLITYLGGYTQDANMVSYEQSRDFGSQQTPSTPDSSTTTQQPQSPAGTKLETSKIEFEVETEGIYVLRAQKANSEEYLVVYYKNGYEAPRQQGVSKEITTFAYYLYAGETYYVNADSEMTEISAHKVENGTETFTETEIGFADVVRGLANGFYKLICSLLGEAITIDDIVFNNYEDIRLDFFEKSYKKQSANIDPSRDQVDISTRSTLIENIAEGVSKWYSFFRSITIVGYIIILIYIAIKILLSAGARTRATFQQLLMHWVMGVAILFLYPYVMKYTIEINELIVESIEKASIAGNLPNISEGELAEEEYDIDYTGNLDKLPEYLADENVTNYMAIMGRKAENSRSLPYAIVYMIMIWQLIFFLVMYYKRVFMVAFLITIFPIVVLSYTLDKIGDGKTQAFDTWSKEFMLNVIVQAFHAIIYVFCLGVSKSAGGNDWLLMIVGVTFIFNLEPIIKSIFGQTSKAGTDTSLGESLTETWAKVTVARKALKSAAKHTKKAFGIAAMEVNAIRDYKKYKNLNSNFDKITSIPAGNTNPSQTVPSYSELDGMPQEPTSEEREFGQAIQILNNPTKVTPRELAAALESYNKYKDKGESFNDMKKNLNVSEDKLKELEKFKSEITEEIKKGTSTEKIQLKIRAEAEYLDPENADEFEKAIIVQMQNTGFTKKRNTGRKAIERELDDAMARTDEISANISFNKGETKRSKEKEEEIDRVATRLFQSSISNSQDVKQMTKEEKEETMEFARNVVKIQNMGEGIYDANEAMDIVNEVATQINKNEMTRNIANELGFDIDEVRHVLAKKVLDEVPDLYGDFKGKKPKEGRANYNIRKKAENIIQEYEKIEKYEQNGEVNVHTVISGAYSEQRENMRKGRINADSMSEKLGISREETSSNKSTENITYRSDVIENIRARRRELNMQEREKTKEFGRQLMEKMGINENQVETPNYTDIEQEPTVYGMTKEELQEMTEISKSLKRAQPAIILRSKSKAKEYKFVDNQGETFKIKLKGDSLTVNPQDDPRVREAIIKRSVQKRQQAKIEKENREKLIQAYLDGKNS